MAFRPEASGHRAVGAPEQEFGDSYENTQDLETDSQLCPNCCLTWRILDEKAEMGHSWKIQVTILIR